MSCVSRSALVNLNSFLRKLRICSVTVRVVIKSRLPSVLVFMNRPLLVRNLTCCKQLLSVDKRIIFNLIQNWNCWNINLPSAPTKPNGFNAAPSTPASKETWITTTRDRSSCPYTVIVLNVFCLCCILCFLTLKWKKNNEKKTTFEKQLNPQITLK